MSTEYPWPSQQDPEHYITDVIGKYMETRSFRDVLFKMGQHLTFGPTKKM